MSVVTHLPVFEWLVDGCPGATNGPEVLGRACPEIVRGGVPLLRAMVFVRTLHPEAMGRWFIWRRAGGAVDMGELHYDRQIEFFANSPIESVVSTGVENRVPLAGPGPFVGELLKGLKEQGGTDYVAMPLRFLDGSLHVVTFATDADGGFTDEHLAMLRDIVRPLSRVAEILASRRTAGNLLDAYVGHGAGERILRGKVRRGDVERIRSVIWFSDLRGFTTLSSTRTPEEVIAVLNRVFDCQVPAVQAEGGEILKFMGDGMLAIFPVGPAGPRSACAQALRAARKAQGALGELNAREGGALAFGIGLHLGEVAYGNIGGAGRLDFTCIGPAVNLAARVESLAGKLGHGILVTDELARASDEVFAPVGSFELKGIDAPVTVHAPAAPVAAT
jgi:adenylate cyclase